MKILFIFFLLIKVFEIHAQLTLPKDDSLAMSFKKSLSKPSFKKDLSRYYDSIINIYENENLKTLSQLKLESKTIKITKLFFKDDTLRKTIIEKLSGAIVTSYYYFNPGHTFETFATIIKDSIGVIKKVYKNYNASRVKDSADYIVIFDNEEDSILKANNFSYLIKNEWKIKNSKYTTVKGRFLENDLTGLNHIDVGKSLLFETTNKEIIVINYSLFKDKISWETIKDTTSTITLNLTNHCLNGNYIEQMNYNIEEPEALFKNLKYYWIIYKNPIKRAKR